MPSDDSVLENKTPKFKTYNHFGKDKITMEGTDGRILQLKQRLSFDSEINKLIKEAAQEFNVTILYLKQLFKKEIGKTISQFVHTLKLEKAKELLETTHKRAKEICYEIGFKEYTHFLRDFKKKYGISPRGLQKESWINRANEEVENKLFKNGSKS